MDTIAENLAIKTADGTMTGFAYHPSDDEPHPTVIVIQEIFGVDNFQFIVIDKSSCDIGISNYVSKDFIKSGRDKVAYALKVYHDYFETEMTDLDAYYLDINL